jgi:hypothetical protein
MSEIMSEINTKEENTQPTAEQVFSIVMDYIASDKNTDKAIKNADINALRNAEKPIQKEADITEKPIQKEADITEKAIQKEAKITEKAIQKEAKITEKAIQKEAKIAEKAIQKEAKIAEKEANKIEKESEIVNKAANDKLIRQNTLKERIAWATTKPQQIKKKEGTTIAQQKKELQENEKKWGNTMIQQTNNGQWTTLLGEHLVFDVLELRGENPRKVVRKDGFEPDWETDEYMYEVKTSNWWIDGTAGEKVYGTFIKYQNIPALYSKRLRIVCVANQEEELTNGKTKYFGENVTEKTKQALDLASDWLIEYVPFSDLILPICTNYE